MLEQIHGNVIVEQIGLTEFDMMNKPNQIMLIRIFEIVYTRMTMSKRVCSLFKEQAHYGSWNHYWALYFEKSRETYLFRTNGKGKETAAIFWVTVQYNIKEQKELLLLLFLLF